jgi:hypothetical protein
LTLYRRRGCILHEDVLLQFDVIGDEMRLWAWPPDRARPATPQITFSGGAFSSGMIALLVGDRYYNSVLGIFRWVEVFESADLDGTGGVDGADFLKWHRSAGRADHG